MEAIPFQRVMVGIDKQGGSRKALAYAAGLARSAGAELVVVHVCEPATAVEPPWYLDWLSPILEDRRKLLERTIESILTDYPRARTILRVGVTDEELLVAAADVGADVVVLGAPRRGFWRALGLDVAERFASISKVPVVLVPP